MTRDTRFGIASCPSGERQRHLGGAQFTLFLCRKRSIILHPKCVIAVAGHELRQPVSALRVFAQLWQPRWSEHGDGFSDVGLGTNNSFKRWTLSNSRPSALLA